MEYYLNKYQTFTLDDISLTQVYGTTDKRLHSNADYKTTIDGINYHLWDIDTANDNYKTMKLSYYYRSVVGTGWYIIALSLSLGLAIVLLIVYIIKRLTNKKYKEKIKINDINQFDVENENGE